VETLACTPTESLGSAKDVAIATHEGLAPEFSCESSQGTKDASQDSKDLSDLPSGAHSSDEQGKIVAPAPSTVVAPESSSEITLRCQTAESGSVEIQSRAVSVVASETLSKDDSQLSPQRSAAMQHSILREIFKAVDIPDMVTMESPSGENFHVEDESVPESIALKDYALSRKDCEVKEQERIASAPAGEEAGVSGVEVSEIPEKSLDTSSATIGLKVCSSDQATKAMSTPDFSQGQDSNSQQLDFSAINLTPSGMNESLQSSLPASHGNESQLWKYRDWALRRDASVAEEMARKAVSTPRADCSLSVAARWDSSEISEDMMSPIIMPPFEMNPAEEALKEKQTTQTSGNPDESLSASLCEKMGDLDLSGCVSAPAQEVADKREVVVKSQEESLDEKPGLDSKSDIQNRGFIGSDTSENDSMDFAVPIAEADLMKLSLVLKEMTGHPEKVAALEKQAVEDGLQGSSVPPPSAVTEDAFTEESPTSLSQDDGNKDVPIVTSAPRSPASEDESVNYVPSSPAMIEDDVPKKIPAQEGLAEEDDGADPAEKTARSKKSPISGPAKMSEALVEKSPTPNPTSPDEPMEPSSKNTPVMSEINEDDKPSSLEVSDIAVEKPCKPVGSPVQLFGKHIPCSAASRASAIEAIGEKVLKVSLSKSTVEEYTNPASASLSEESAQTEEKLIPPEDDAPKEKLSPNPVTEDLVKEQTVHPNPSEEYLQTPTSPKQSSTEDDSSKTSPRPANVDSVIEGELVACPQTASSPPSSPAAKSDLSEPIRFTSIEDSNQNPASSSPPPLESRTGEKAPHSPSQAEPESLVESSLTLECSVISEVAISSQTMTDEKRSQEKVPEKRPDHPAALISAKSGGSLESLPRSSAFKVDCAKESVLQPSPATKNESPESASLKSLEEYENPTLSSPPPLKDRSGRDAPTDSPKGVETRRDSPSKPTSVGSRSPSEVSSSSSSPDMKRDSPTKHSALITAAMRDSPCSSSPSSPAMEDGLKKNYQIPDVKESLEVAQFRSIEEHKNPGVPSPPSLTDPLGKDAPDSPPENTQLHDESPVKLSLTSESVSAGEVPPSSQPLATPPKQSMKDDVPKEDSLPSSRSLSEDFSKESSLSSPAPRDESSVPAAFMSIEEHNKNSALPSPPPLRSNSGKDAPNSPPEETESPSESPVKSRLTLGSVVTPSKQAPAMKADSLAAPSSQSLKGDSPKESSPPSSPVLSKDASEKSFPSPPQNEPSDPSAFISIEHNEKPALPSPPPLRNCSEEDAPNSPPEETASHSASPAKSPLTLESPSMISPSEQAQEIRPSLTETFAPPSPSKDDDIPKEHTPRSSQALSEDCSMETSPSTPAPKDESAAPAPFTSTEEHNEKPAEPSPPSLRNRSGKDAPNSPLKKTDTPSESPVSSPTLENSRAVSPLGQASATRADSLEQGSALSSSSVKDDHSKESSPPSSPVLSEGGSTESSTSSATQKNEPSAASSFTSIEEHNKSPALPSPPPLRNRSGKDASNSPPQTDPHHESPAKSLPTVESTSGVSTSVRAPDIKTDSPRGSAPTSPCATAYFSKKTSLPASPSLVEGRISSPSPTSSFTSIEEHNKNSALPSPPPLSNRRGDEAPNSPLERADSCSDSPVKSLSSSKSDCEMSPSRQSVATTVDSPTKSSTQSSPVLKIDEKESSSPSSSALTDLSPEKSTAPSSPSQDGSSPRKSSPPSSPDSKRDSLQKSSPPSSPALKDDSKGSSPLSSRGLKDEPKESSPPSSPASKDDPKESSSSSPVLEDYPMESSSSSALRDETKESSPEASPTQRRDLKENTPPSSWSAKDADPKKSSAPSSPAMEHDGLEKRTPSSSPIPNADIQSQDATRVIPPEEFAPTESMNAELKEDIVTEEVMDPAKEERCITEPEDGEPRIDICDDSSLESSQNLSSPELSYSDAEDGIEEQSRAHSAEPPTQYSYLDSVKKTLSRLSSSFENLLGRRSPKISVAEEPVSTKEVSDDVKESNSPNSTFFSPIADNAKEAAAEDLPPCEKLEETSRGPVDHTAPGSPYLSPSGEDLEDRGVADSPTVSSRTLETNFGAVSTPLKVDKGSESPTTESDQTNIDINPEDLRKRMEAMFERMRRMEQQLSEFTDSPIIPERSEELPETILLDSDEDLIPETPGARTGALLGRRSLISSQPEDEVPSPADGPVPRSVSFSEKVVHLDDVPTEAVLQESSAKPKYAPTPFKPSPVLDAEKVSKDIFFCLF